MAANATVEAGGFTVLERVAVSVFGFLFGVVGASLVVLAVGGDDVSVLYVALSGAACAAALGISPPLKARGAVTPEVSITPGEPVPLGSLARAFNRELEPKTTQGLHLGVIVGFSAPLAALALYAVADARPSPFVLAGVGVVAYAAAVACLMVLPPFLLDDRSRRAFAVKQWAGAREFERMFGSKRAALDFPGTPEEAQVWLAERVNWDDVRPVDVQMMVFAGDFDAARRAVEQLPTATPYERYVKAEHDAFVRYQSTGDMDRSDLWPALDAMPAGRERLEAATSLAVDEARLVLPDGDFRAPLVAVRELIPESDARILIRDHGWAPFTVMLLKYWYVAVVLVALSVGLGLLRPFG